MIDLVTPGASAPWHESSSIASRADPLFAGDGYLLLDTHRLAADDLRMENAAALLAGLENPSLEAGRGASCGRCAGGSTRRNSSR